jgi:hypothetical protein
MHTIGHARPWHRLQPVIGRFGMAVRELMEWGLSRGRAWLVAGYAPIAG